MYIYLSLSPRSNFPCGMAALKAHKRSVSRVMLYEIILESTKCAKCTKHLSVGANLEVEMSKKCMSLWHEAYFEGKSVNN